MTYRLTDEDLRTAEMAARRFQATWWQGTSGTLAAWVILLLKERKLMATTLEESNKALREAVEARLAGTPLECCTLTPAEPAEEVTFTDPEPVAVQPPEQVEAAWAAIKERQRQLHENLRNPQAATPVERREVEAGDAAVPYRGPEAFIGRWAASRAAEADKREADRQQPLRPGSREFLAVLDELRDLHLRKTLDYGVDEDALSNIRSSADVCNMPAWAGCVLRMMDKMHRLKAFFRRGRTEFDGVEDTLKDLACYAAIALVLYREAKCTKVQ